MAVEPMEMGSRVQLEPMETDSRVQLEPMEMGSRVQLETLLYKCSECGREFHCPQKYRTHMAVHDETSKCFLCDMCGKGFITAARLKKHGLVHSDVKPVQCLQCNRRFKEGGALSRHIRSRHTKDRPYVCKICGDKFSVAGILKVHMRTHTGERPYECKTCGDRFTISGALKVHLRTHTGERPYTCSLCPKRFINRGHLQSHINSHMGAKQCKVCGRRFSTADSLATHLRAHGCMKITEGGKTYMCTYCSSDFSTYGDLTSHARLIHNTPGEPTPSADTPREATPREATPEEGTIDRENRTRGDTQHLPTCPTYRVTGERGEPAGRSTGVKGGDTTGNTGYATAGSGIPGNKRKYTGVNNAITGAISTCAKVPRQNTSIIQAHLETQLNLKGTPAPYSKVPIQGTSLQGSLRTPTSIQGTSLQGPLGTPTSIQGTSLHGPLGTPTSNQGTSLQGPLGTPTSIQGTSLQGPLGTPTSIQGTSLQGPLGTPTSIQGTSLQGPLGTPTSIQGTSLQGSLGTPTSIQGTNLQGSLGTPTSIQGTNLQGPLGTTQVEERRGQHLCSVCGKTFLQPCALGQHMRVHSGGRTYSCPLCPKVYTNQGLLLKHMGIHTVDPHLVAETYPCPLCSKVYTDRGLLQEHMRVHTKGKGSACDVCGLQFTHVGTLLKHKRTHLLQLLQQQPQQQHQHQQQQKPQHKQQQQQSHLPEQHPQQERQQQPQEQQQSLQQQQQKRYQQSQEPQQQQSEQPPQQQQLQYLSQQQQQHPGQQQLLQLQQQQKSVKCGAELRRHMKYRGRVTATRRTKHYYCALCSKIYLNYGNLKRHMMTHLVCQPCVCSICKMDFNHNSNNLVNHLMEHCQKLTESRKDVEDEEPLFMPTSFRCTRCEKCFLTPEELADHMTRTHSPQGAPRTLNTRVLPQQNHSVMEIAPQEASREGEMGGAGWCMQLTNQHNALTDVGAQANLQGILLKLPNNGLTAGAQPGLEGLVRPFPNNGLTNGAQASLEGLVQKRPNNGLTNRAQASLEGLVQKLPNNGLTNGAQASLEGLVQKLAYNGLTNGAQASLEGLVQKLHSNVGQSSTIQTGNSTGCSPIQVTAGTHLDRQVNGSPTTQATLSCSPTWAIAGAPLNGPAHLSGSHIPVTVDAALGGPVQVYGSPTQVSAGAPLGGPVQVHGVQVSAGAPLGGLVQVHGSPTQVAGTETPLEAVSRTSTAEYIMLPDNTAMPLTTDHLHPTTSTTSTSTGPGDTLYTSTSTSITVGTLQPTTTSTMATGGTLHPTTSTATPGPGGTSHSNTTRGPDGTLTPGILQANKVQHVNFPEVEFEGQVISTDPVVNVANEDAVDVVDLMDSMGPVEQVDPVDPMDLVDAVDAMDVMDVVDAVDAVNAVVAMDLTHCDWSLGSNNTTWTSEDCLKAEQYGITFDSCGTTRKLSGIENEVCATNNHPQSPPSNDSWSLVMDQLLISNHGNCKSDTHVGYTCTIANGGGGRFEHPEDLISSKAELQMVDSPIDYRILKGLAKSTVQCFATDLSIGGMDNDSPLDMSKRDDLGGDDSFQNDQDTMAELNKQMDYVNELLFEQQPLDLTVSKHSPLLKCTCPH